MNKYKPYFEDKGNIKQQIRVSTRSHPTPLKSAPAVNVISPTEQTVMQARAKVKRAAAAAGGGGKRKYSSKRKPKPVKKKSQAKGRRISNKQRKKRSKVDIFDDVA